VANLACACRLIPSFLNILNSLYVSGQRQKSSTLLLTLHFNAITLHQSGLGKKYQQHGSLPDYFSQELGLHPGDDPEENLRALAKRHKELSGSLVNWLGTYLHAATVWQKGLQYKGA
jgi:hypothetical protein